MADERGELLLTIKRPPNEELRVVLDQYKGKQFVNVRVWYDAGENDWRPGNKGISIKLTEAEEVAKAIMTAVINETQQT